MRDRSFAALLLVPVAAALGLSYGRIVASLDDTPADADYTAARAILEAQHFTHGDALAILPAWSLRPLTVLGDLDPISADHLDEHPLHRYARLFVVVEPSAEDAHDALVAKLGAPAFTARAGRVAVERFDLPAPSVTFDFTDQLIRAHVRITGATEDACPLDADREPPHVQFTCNGRPAWQRVQREWLLVSENADLAVWSHPPPRGQQLEIAWDDVPIGTAIVVRAGHTREGADAGRAKVRVHVLIGDDEVGVVERAPVFHFRTDTIDTSKYRGQRARVTFVEDTDDEASNHFAWDAYAIDAPAARDAGGGR